MDTESLQALLERLESSSSLEEAGPPLALANAVQFVNEAELEGEQAQLQEAISEKYQELCKKELLRFLDHEDCVENRDGFRVLTIYVDSMGKTMLPSEGTFSMAISAPFYEEPDEEKDEYGYPKGLLNGLVKGLHQARVSRAVELTDEMEESES